MNNETIIDTQPKTNLTWWVRFVKQTGKIRSISPSMINDFNDDESILETNNQICLDFIKNKVSKRKYAVLWDPFENNWKIDKKSDTLVIKTRHNKLEQFHSGKDPSTSDVHATISKVNGELKLTANLEQIAKHLHLSKIQNIVNDTEGLIDLYLTKKNDPDYLLQILSIDPEELILKGSTIVKLDKSVMERTDWNNISIYTKPVFLFYSMEFIESTVIPEKEKANIGQLSKAKRSDKFTRNAEINICILNDKIKIYSSLSKQQSYMFKGKKFLQLHICDTEIDHYLTTLNLLGLDLCTRDSVTVEKPDTWPLQPLITFKDSKIRVNYYLGEKND